MQSGALDLLIIQGTPFCNIDCKYCYLADRLSTKKISLETVDTVLEKVFNSGIVRKDFTIVWHAGEPLVLPINFYKSFTQKVKQKNNTSFEVRQSIQSNGTLLNQNWCDFIKANDIRIGLSIDGNEFIHNKNRITRKGVGTHAKVMKAVNLLHQNKIPFHVIAVITATTLDYPDEFFNFFIENNIPQMGFNVEEIEGVHQFSTLTNENMIEKFKSFISRIYKLYLQSKDKISIREFRQLEALIFKGGLRNTISQQSTPYRILNVDADGNFSTFSPELLGMHGKEYGNFQIGNLLTDTLEDALQTEKFNAIYSDILTGIINCKKSCNYFSVCGGGAPSNKFSEHGTFTATETSYCRFKHQAMFDVVISEVEASLPS